MASSGKCNHEPSSCMSGDGDSPDRHPHERRGNASPGALGRKDDMQPEELAKPLGTVAVQILHSPCIKARGRTLSLLSSCKLAGARSALMQLHASFAEGQTERHNTETFQFKTENEKGGKPSLRRQNRMRNACGNGCVFNQSFVRWTHAHAVPRQHLL